MSLGLKLHHTHESAVTHHPEIDTMPTGQDYAERTGHAVDPAPVVVRLADGDEPTRVSQAPRRGWNTGQVPCVVGAPPIALIGRNPFRERVIIRTPAAGGVYIGPTSEGLTVNSGLWIGPAGREELTTWHEVYVIADPANAGPISVTFAAERADG